MEMMYSDCGRWFSTPSIAVYRHDPMMCKTASTYLIVAKNIELARMQGVEPGRAHVVAVVDDFGDLVEVPR